jgi:hypothetical protein
MMLKSLSAGGLNLAILGDDEVALAFYARKIYEHLKTDPDAQVDLCLSADAEKLVQRFNQILSELTLDEALDKTIKAPQKRFLIFPDTQFIQDFELQLLARLINGLPASNLFVVLIFNKREPYEKKLQSFGKNLVQWVLESEHPTSEHHFSHSEGWRKDPTDDVMSAKDFKARQRSLLGAGASGVGAGAGVDGDDFLNQSPLGERGINPQDTLKEKESGRTEPVLSQDELMAAVRSVQEQLDQEESAEKDKSNLQTSASSSKSNWLGWSLLLGLLVSMGVLGAVYKDRIVQEMDSMKEYLEGPKWEKKSQDKPSPDGAADHGSNPSKGSQDATAPSKEGEGGSKETETKEDVAREKQPSVGMSSSTKVPIKLDDSLIPDKEAVLSAQENKDKAKLEHKESSTPVALEPTPALSQKPVPTKSAPSEKSDIKLPALSAGNAPLKEEPLRIPVLKDPVPLDTAKGGMREGKKEMAKDQFKDLTKDQSKDKDKDKLKEKAKDSPSDLTDKPRESLNASGAVPRSDLDWVNALPEKSWVLQLAAMPNKADLQAFKNAQPAFEGAKILFTQNPSSGKTYYILIKGPMASKEEAQRMMTQGSGLSNAWLRSSKSLKAQFKGN